MKPAEIDVFVSERDALTKALAARLTESRTPENFSDHQTLRRIKTLNQILAPYHTGIDYARATRDKRALRDDGPLPKEGQGRNVMVPSYASHPVSR